MAVTKEMYEAAKEALEIVLVGAVNASGVSHSLSKAYHAWIHAGADTDTANKNPAAILMLSQMAMLAGMEFTDETERGPGYWALSECKAIVEEYERGR